MKELATSKIVRLCHRGREARQPEACKEQFKSVRKWAAYGVIALCLLCTMSREHMVSYIVDPVQDTRHVVLPCQCNFVSRSMIKRTLCTTSAGLSPFFPSFNIFCSHVSLHLWHMC
jgi:hypothetical protein